MHLTFHKLAQALMRPVPFDVLEAEGSCTYGLM
jgi:hypothetical protein